MRSRLPARRALVAGHKAAVGNRRATSAVLENFLHLRATVVTHVQPENSLVRGGARAVLVQRATSLRQDSRRALDVPIQNIRTRKGNRRARAVDSTLIYGLPSLRLNGGHG